MADLSTAALHIDWKSIAWLGTGIVFGGLLKEVVKDFYRRVSKKYFPDSTPEQPTQLIVQMTPSPAAAFGAIELKPVSVERVSQLSAEDIRKTIETAPPLQQAGVRQNFNGIRVQWEMTFHSAEEAGANYRVWFQTPKVLSLVACEVSAADYPELKILHAGAPVRVIGTISTISALLVIELTDVRLEILG